VCKNAGSKIDVPRRFPHKCDVLGARKRRGREGVVEGIEKRVYAPN
jgi:hypothetical protein